MAQEVNVRGIARVPFGAGSASTTTISGSAVATLDLDNGQTRRTLQNDFKARGICACENG